MDFKNFKKIASDSKSTTLKSPEGHKIIVAHHALSPKMRQQVKAIPTKYAEGGEVEDEGGRSPASLLNPEDAQAASDKKLGISSKERAALDSVKTQEGAIPSDNFGPARPAPGIMDRVNNALTLPGEQAELANKQWQSGIAADKAAMSAAPQGPAPASLGQPGLMANPSPAPQDQDPMGYGQQMKQMQQGFGQEMLGAKNLASAKAAEGADEAKAADLRQQDLQRFMQVHEQKFQALQKERENILRDIDKGHINPNHYQESQTTGQKVLTTIGLILGGMAAGWNGGENQARKFLNQQIDRDIDSQKAELGKKQSLLSANLQEFGNLKDAESMTRVNLNDIYSAQVAKAAAKSMGPQAAAQAQMFIGQKNNESAQLMQPLALKRAAMSMANGAAGDPATLVRYMVPEAHQKAVFDEIERAQDTKRMGGAILASFDQAAKENTVLKTGAGMLRTPPSVLALHQSMQPTFKDLEGTVRQAAMDNTFKNITPAPGDMDATVSTKREALVDYLKSKASAPTAKGFGIDLDKFASTKTPSAANPYEGHTATNPQGQKIIMKGGSWVPYGR